MSELLLQLLRARVEPSKVKRVSGAKGGEYHSPCPLCGGEDRFIVFPEQEGGDLCQKHGISGTWACPRHCGIGGDAIDWFTKIEGMNFAAACQELHIPTEREEKARRPYRPLRQPRQDRQDDFVPASFDAPVDAWQAQATKLATEAHERLLATPNILAWLAKRGLPESAVREYRLGYIEGEGAKGGDCIFRARKAFGLPEKVNGQGKPVRAFRIPRGVTIPAWSREGRCLRIRIRRRDADRDRGNAKDPKYLLVPQPGKPYSAPLMLPPVNVPADLATWVIVEAELDAMAVHHACRGKVGAISILTVRVKPDQACHAALSRAARILVALDADEDKPDGSNPGADAWPWWEATYPQAQLWPVPEGKDPGEAFSRGVDLAEWVFAGAPLVHLDCEAAVVRPQADVRRDVGSLGKNFLKAAAAEGMEERKSPAQMQTRRLHAPGRPRELVLWTPTGPLGSLQVLEELGLTVERTFIEGKPDFVLHGQERWPDHDMQRLFAWVRKWGHFVNMALYPDEYGRETP